MRATYRIHDDKLRLYPDERLPESDYKAARERRFLWCPGQKCFAATWSPWAEDFCLGMVAEIEIDEQCDNAEERAERFAGYAETAAETAEQAAARIAEGRANTERRLRLTTGVMGREESRAQYWADRAKASARHAEFMHRPDVIARRIATIEKDIRKAEKETSKTEYYTQAHYAGLVVRHEGKLYLKKPEFIPAEFTAKWEAHCALWNRWKAHAEMLRDYWQAFLAAIPGAESFGVGVEFEVGGTVLCHWSQARLTISKVNKKTVEVDMRGRGHWLDFAKVEKTRCRDYQPPVAREVVA